MIQKGINNIFACAWVRKDQIGWTVIAASPRTIYYVFVYLGQQGPISCVQRLLQKGIILYVLFSKISCSCSAVLLDNMLLIPRDVN